jgi:K+ transporter
MRKCFIVFIILVLSLTGCNSISDESEEINITLSQYLSLIVEKDFEDAFDYIIYFTDKPHSVEKKVAKEIWLQRVEYQNEANSYILSYDIQSIEQSDDNRNFALAKVEMTITEKGIKNKRNIYVHLEKVNDDWKIGYYFLEDHSHPDPITYIYGGYVSQSVIKTFNKK